MKTKIFCFCLLAFSSTACNHLLDVKPASFSSGETYYQTEQQVLRAAEEMETALDAQLHAMDNLDPDDIEALRQRRVQEMKRCAVECLSAGWDTCIVRLGRRRPGYMQWRSVIHV